MDIEKQEHVDLEEIFQISTLVEFEGTGATFEGMKEFEVKNVQKKKEKKIEIVNVTRKPVNKSKSGGLF